MGLFNKKQRQERREARQGRREQRQSARQDRRADRQERRSDRRENRQERREDRRENRQELREERREERGERRELREEGIVRRNERALVVYSEFNEDNDPAMMRRLYGFVERQGVSVAMTVLQGSYDRVIPVTGPAATLDRFIDAIEEALVDDDIDEVDVLFHSHGNYSSSSSKAYVYFAPGPEGGNGKTNVADVGDRIEDLDSGDRLRMFYTTACWGGKFAEEMVRSGFSCGAGSLDVNTNSALEYPLFLAHWKLGMSFGSALRKAEKRSAYRQTDGAARLIKGDFWASADSRKQFFGDSSVNKRSNAAF